MINNRAFKIGVLLLVFGGLIFGILNSLPMLLMMAVNTLYLGVGVILLFLFIYGLYRLVKWAFS